MCTKKLLTQASSIFLIIGAALLMTACTVSWDGDLDREAGREARRTVDQVIDQTGQFFAGFCEASVLPLAVAGLALAGWRLTIRQ